MSHYYMNEAVFDLPERPFADKTLHALESSLPEGQTLGVFVHRSPIEAGKELRALADGHIALNLARLSGYAVIEDVLAPVAGLPGVLLRTRWRLEGVTYYQRQAHVIVGGTWMIFAVTAPLAEQGACDETFESIVQTITFRAG